MEKEIPICNPYLDKQTRTKKLRFLRKNGYVIYSVGKNLKDDGGVDDQNDGDISFMIVREAE